MSSNITVIKYGGSSLATVDHIRFVARQIIERKRPDEQVVVVASAMGDTTDQLMSLAARISNDPPLRELDKILGTGEHVSTALLCLALRELGHEAVSLTGAQGGIRTNAEYFNATIEHVDCTRVRRELDRGRIVVVAGYQGCNEDGEITTLGRGGSDTTAVVLAEALGVARCVISSDVDGVYSADPRVVEDARRIAHISYTEMLEMARHGASVLDPRAVERARRAGVQIYARDTFRPDAPGTLIDDLTADEPRVIGVAGHEALLPVVIEGTDGHGATDALLAGVEPDDIFMDRTDDETGRRSMLIPRDRLPDQESFADRLRREFHDRVKVAPYCSSVSAIGLGVGGAAEIRRRSRQFSQQAGVSPQGDFSGEHSVTCLVRPEEAARVMNVFHSAFECPSENAA